LRSAALKHEVGAYGHHWKILPRGLVRGNDSSWHQAAPIDVRSHVGN
jgi:hypothetical protein